jgi:N-acetylmuramoyl-L-alanine amidase
MTTRTNICIVATLLGVGIVGCQQPQRRPVDITFEEHTITVDDLASRLGLRVAERDETFVVLRDAANTVLIFTHTDGRVFVNGRPIGAAGTVKSAGRTVYVPETLTSQIRSHLQIPGAQPPTPARRTAGLVVVDAGHGGKDPGTASPGGIREKPRSPDCSNSAVSASR